MARRPETPVRFDLDGCPDIGTRRAVTPPPLPAVPDDIDLRARDYDGLRRVMLEDLAARQPDRSRWSPADEEVVLVEAFATVLDELSDMLDRGFAEAFLDTARRPASVRWLLGMIGIDAAAEALAAGDLAITREQLDSVGSARDRADVLAAHLDLYWLQNPAAMDAAQAAGPGRIREQQRAVTVADHVLRMVAHPLVARAAARERWHGSWPQVVVAVVIDDALDLDTPLGGWATERRRAAVTAVHGPLGLPDPPWDEPTLTARTVLVPYLDRLRMAGTEAVLSDVVAVPVLVSVSIQVGPDHWRSEVGDAVRAALGSGPGGLFEPGRFAIGEDLHASDVLEVAGAVDGVAGVGLNRFQRRGDRFTDRSAEGVVVLGDLEVPVLGDRDSGLRIAVHGGRIG